MRKAEEVAPGMERVAQQLGARVAELRRGLGLTQEEVARQAGLCASYVSMLERGRRLPQLAALQALARALHTNMAALLADDANQGPPTAAPMVAFIQSRALTLAEVRRLLAMARVMFSRPEVGP